MKKRIGFYVGSFNPFHILHKNIVDQAKKIFDEVILGVGDLIGEKPNSSNINSISTKKKEELLHKYPDNDIECKRTSIKYRFTEIYEI